MRNIDWIRNRVSLFQIVRITSKIKGCLPLYADAQGTQETNDICVNALFYLLYLRLLVALYKLSLYKSTNLALDAYKFDFNHVLPRNMRNVSFEAIIRDSFWSNLIFENITAPIHCMKNINKHISFFIVS